MAEEGVNRPVSVDTAEAKARLLELEQIAQRVGTRLSGVQSGPSSVGPMEQRGGGPYTGGVSGRMGDSNAVVRAGDYGAAIGPAIRPIPHFAGPQAEAERHTAGRTIDVNARSTQARASGATRGDTIRDGESWFQPEIKRSGIEFLQGVGFGLNGFQGSVAGVAARYIPGVGAVFGAVGIAKAGGSVADYISEALKESRKSGLELSDVLVMRAGAAGKSAIEAFGQMSLGVFGGLAKGTAVGGSFVAGTAAYVLDWQSTGGKGPATRVAEFFGADFGGDSFSNWLSNRLARGVENAADYINAMVAEGETISAAQVALLNARDRASRAASNMADRLYQLGVPGTRNSNMRDALAQQNAQLNDAVNYKKLGLSDAVAEKLKEIYNNGESGN